MREAKKKENEIIEGSNSHFVRGKLWLNSVAGGSHLALGTCHCCGWLRNLRVVELKIRWVQVNPHLLSCNITLSSGLGMVPPRE